MPMHVVELDGELFGKSEAPSFPYIIPMKKRDAIMLAKEATWISGSKRTVYKLVKVESYIGGKNEKTR